MLPEFETFLNSERLDQFWEMVRWVLFFVAPVVMIFFAVDLINWVVNAVKRAAGINKKDDDDDDDYEIYRY